MLCVYHLLSIVSSVITIPSIHSLPLNLKDIKVILLSNDAAFIPLSNIYHLSLVYMNVSTIRLCRTSNTLIAFFSLSYLFSLTVSNCCTSLSFVPRRLGNVSKHSGDFLYHICHKTLFHFSSFRYGFPERTTF